MQALENQIITLVNQGLKAKAVTEAVKKAGILTKTGKVPTYAYIQNKIQTLKKAGSFRGSKSASNKKAGYNYSNRMAEGVNLGDSTVCNILTSNDLSDSKKVAVLKAWFA